jgi:hypothetical protein
LLRPDVGPSEFLEERVVRTLKAKGLLETPRPKSTSRPVVYQLARIAAILLVFVSGLAVGQWTVRRADPPDQPQAAQTDSARPSQSDVSRQLYWF